MTAYLFALGRIVTNPVSNVFQKKLTQKKASPIFIVFLTYLTLSLLGLPFLFILAIPAEVNFWISILLAAVFDSLGNLFLVKSLKETELSIFGPINSFKPVFALIFSVFVLQEIPNLYGVVGIIIILAGSYVLTLTSKKESNKSGLIELLRSSGFWFRISAIILTSLGAVYIKKSIIYSTPIITLIFWAILGLPTIIAVIFMFYREKIIQNISVLKSEKLNYLGAVSNMIFMQLFTLLTFQYIFVGYSLAIFQFQSVISVFLGYKFFHEKNIKTRFIGAIIMVIGVLCVVIK